MAISPLNYYRHDLFFISNSTRFRNKNKRKKFSQKAVFSTAQVDFGHL